MTNQSSLEYDVFISYARADGRDEADHLYHEFGGVGLKAWRDERSLDPYQDFSGEIEIAIEKSQYVVVCLTPSLLAHYDDRTGKRKDSFVRREIIYAQGCEKPIIPLVFPNFPKGKVPTLINHLTWLDFNNFGKGFADLMARLQAGVEYQARHTDDPYYDYLVGLQKSIVRFLDSTVFTLLALHTAPTPDAVNAPPREVKARNLPMSFGGFDFAALPVKKTTIAAVEEVIQNPPEIFNDFPAAFEHYGGRVLLLGEPGAGKTTTLMAYAREAVAARLEKSDLPLPLLARIVNWDAKQQPPLAEWLSAMGGLDFHDEISAGHVLLLLDGLDELGSELEDAKTKEHFDPRQRFIEAVNAVPSENRVLVSCRIKDYGSIGEKVALKGAVTLQPLDDAQLTEYLHDEPALYAAIQADEGLREMSRTPLLLSILTYAYRGMGDKARQLENLKDSPGELRDKIWNAYIRRRYKHEKCKPHADLPYGLWKMIKVLREIILEEAGIGGNSFDELVVEMMLEDNPAKFIEQIKRLHLVTSDEAGLQFIHLLLYDYLAFEPLMANLRKLQDDKLVEEIRRVREELYEESGSYDRESDDIDFADEAAQALGIMREKRAVDLLINALKCFDYNVCNTAARALGEIGDTRAIEPLISALDDEDDWFVGSVARALGSFRDERVVDALIKKVRDGEKWAKQGARQGLIEIRQLAIKPLTQLLEDPSVDLQSYIAPALTLIGTPDALAAVEEWERQQHKKGHP